MNRRRFFENPDFAEYVRLLGRLYRLMRAHLDESDEGEALREQMDRPGEALSEEEIRAVKGIAADLASIGQENGIGSNRVSAPPVQLRDAIDAIQRHDVVDALLILREHAHEIPPAPMSYFRGQAFESVGLIEIAVDFFHRASQLAPENLDFACLWLEALSHADPAKARVVASDILARRSDYSPFMVFEAASIIYQATSELPDSEQHRALTELRSAFSDAVIAMEMLAVPAPMRSAAYALLGLCQNRMGESDEARRCFDRALDLDPNFSEALVARGMLLYDIDAARRKIAVGDFRRAIELGCKLPWPYFFLAHDALLHENFDDVLRLANTAFNLSVSDCLRSYLLQWVAISMASLHYPQQAVRSVFEDAIRLAPEEQQFRVNLERFDEQLRNTSQGRVHWVQTPVNRVQQLAFREYRPAGVT